MKYRKQRLNKYSNMLQQIIFKRMIHQGISIKTYKTLKRDHRIHDDEFDQSYRDIWQK